MPTFHFQPAVFGDLTWFNDSPDTGDPACVCSLCGKVIEEGEIPLRIFRPSNNTELRLHMRACAEKAIMEFRPSDVGNLSESS